ncbi:nuclear transport factor 2 family protein [Streptomyces sp. NPDC007896]|uniref:nuclear transport factor 2 family protein n=1 Tax=Streptomyces sp. NPDC007896 TaxID=3364784 RepID=UPI00143E3FE3|nr:nuclear transport factor 2 family protein [Streptomyces sp. S1D4-11]QIZ01032.1 nuclear transport factor 2 family protein [Streptomyces sp. S1D4-11]
MPASPPPTLPPIPVGGRPGGTPADLAAIWAVITGTYQAYTAGDRERIDSFLDPDATIWDSATPELVCGKAELDRVRDARTAAAAGTAEAGLTAYGQVIDVFADLAVARYWLRVDFHAATPELARNTAVLRRGGSDAGWLIVHLHEDVHGAAGT